MLLWEGHIGGRTDRKKDDLTIIILLSKESRLKIILIAQGQVTGMEVEGMK
jgi:hypothetical protein